MRLGISKVHLCCLTKISNVSRYEFTSIAAYKLVGSYTQLKCKFTLKAFFWFQKGFSVEITETLLDPLLLMFMTNCYSYPL